MKTTKLKPTRVRRYLVKIWEFDSCGIVDNATRRLIGWRGSVPSAANRADQLNQAYAKL
jgi:hypothetical protein